MVERFKIDELHLDAQTRAFAVRPASFLVTSRSRTSSRRLRPSSPARPMRPSQPLSKPSSSCLSAGDVPVSCAAACEGC